MWPYGPNLNRTICCFYSRLKITSLNISVPSIFIRQQMSLRGPFIWLPVITFVDIGYGRTTLCWIWISHRRTPLTSDIFVNWFGRNHQVWNSSASKINIRFPLYITSMTLSYTIWFALHGSYGPNSQSILIYMGHIFTSI